MTLGDSLVNAVLIVRAVSREGRQGIGELVEQRGSPRAVVALFLGQLDRDNFAALATVLQGCHRAKFGCLKLGHSGDPDIARASKLEHPVQAGGGDGDLGGLGLVSSRS